MGVPGIPRSGSHVRGARAVMQEAGFEAGVRVDPLTWPAPVDYDKIGILS